MAKSIVSHASRVLNVLPAAHFLTRTLPSPRIVAAAAVLKHPAVRRAAPGLSALATVGLATLALVSLAKRVKARKQARIPGDAGALERSSAT
ncbi:hypothetical protein AEAC466_13290 [Asticcacaulis sp. AC466]|uniref:hypothetical protein n=1 Tax=Asticcacaulis sp. AC466 TaxID=1282362 RepID=UPI0003C3CEB9|nr:hypothetical protein [Asticcacaulis sp. AC466]ESQ83220.1 hypothetical protein AEAC466_13290 [Asticcacaulis sp. AC466]